MLHATQQLCPLPRLPWNQHRQGWSRLDRGYATSCRTRSQPDIDVSSKAAARQDQQGTRSGGNRLPRADVKDGQYWPWCRPARPPSAGTNRQRAQSRAGPGPGVPPRRNICWRRLPEPSWVGRRRSWLISKGKGYRPKQVACRMCSMTNWSWVSFRFLASIPIKKCQLTLKKFDCWTGC